MSKPSGSIDSLVLQHIRRIKPSTIFTPRDVAAAGPRTAVASALSRHLKAGAIKQPANYPKEHGHGYYPDKTQ